MLSSFQNKVVVVSGGANGIGRAICTAFVEAGAVLVLLDIDKRAGKHAEREFCVRGGRALFLQVDVSEPRGVGSAFVDVERRFQRVDVLVNNAAIAVLGTVLDYDVATWDRVLAVNLRSVYLCSRSALPIMHANGSGAIVNIGSAHSCVARRSYAAYTASKFAVLGLTKAMALDHAPTVRVNAVLPGATDTEGFRREVEKLSDPAEYLAQIPQRYPMGRTVRPSDIADCVLFLASDRAASITGAAVPVDAGLLAAV